MRVLFVTPLYYPNLKGGSERSLKILAEGMVKKGVGVSVLSFDNDKKGVLEEKLNGVKVIRVKKMKITPNTLAYNVSLLRYKGIVERENPDIVHVYNTWQMPAAYFLKTSKRKVIASLNNYYPICPISYTKNNLMERKKFNFITMFFGLKDTLNLKFPLNYLAALGYALYWKPIYFFSSRLDLYIPISRTTGKIFALQGFDEKKIKFVCNLFDKDNLIIYKSKKRKKNMAIYVGALIESKGVLEMLEAFRKIKNKKLKLYLIGGGVLSEDVKKYINEHKLNAVSLGRLKFEELKKYYSSCSFTIHPSLWPDPFPRVMMEIMQHDCPVLAADNPVAIEAFGEGALYYHRGDIQDFADKIDLIAGGKVKKSLVKSREKIFSKNPIDEIYSHYLRLLK